MGRSSLANQIEDYVIKNKDKYYRLAFSYVKNADDALDVVQESIYKGISTMGTLKTPGYIKTWFYKIVVNTSIDLLRKRKKLVIVDDETLFQRSKASILMQKVSLLFRLTNMRLLQGIWELCNLLYLQRLYPVF